MSAALQFPAIAMRADIQAGWQVAPKLERAPQLNPQADPDGSQDHPIPVSGVAFYRKHTEKLLRRYLYSSMLVGRAPSILAEPLTRGWASSRPVHTFEDCVIFVLDMENCLAKLEPLDRLIISRIVIQEYSQSEAALLLRLSERTLRDRFFRAMDQLTQILMDTGQLKLPH
ncbi:MAG TPA: sigma factor-like helix-turn-helix DNA-binding protein [Terracidiphilus sp.]|jgi:hypothetical protein|nr:sigma factor-like helix-turn-helix DNA-binding protein [Terracidiphilus sp.]